MQIFNIIVQTNTFNFIIFVILFAIIIKFAKVGNLISSMQLKVKQYVDDSEKAKINSETELKKAEEKVNNVGEEIKEIMDNADLNAVRIERKILADANIQSESILFNADKLNDANGKRIISDLSQEAALTSVELAKKHIIKVLDKKPQYHAKFIEDCIKELDGFTF
ncbi:ATP synthase F0 subunit B [bacterium]|nr:ATP synthase F0 subunit B [bacterium]